jgi:outer membrane beta-barrel protein
MTKNLLVLLAAALGAAGAMPASAQSSSSSQAASGQVVVPEVERRAVKLPRIPSKDLELGVMLGSYGTQNFGTSMVGGLRLGYHITEDFFVEGGYGASKVNDDNYRQVLPGGLFPTGKETLKYLSLSAGVNVLPGEIFIGRNNARASQVYVLGGIGSTRFIDQRKQTFHFGVGLKVLLTERMALRVDMRDHVFSLDLLGKRERTQNLELSAGFSTFF